MISEGFSIYLPLLYNKKAMIIDDTIRYLLLNHTEAMNRLTIVEVRIGIHLTAVKLSDGSYGMAGTWVTSGGGAGAERDYGKFTPNHITGKSVAELFHHQKKTSVAESIPFLYYQNCFYLVTGFLYSNSMKMHWKVKTAGFM
jgi:hypothetical protein